MLNSTSKRFPNGFGNDSDQLGRNIMDHHLGVGAARRCAGLRGHVLLGPAAERHLRPALPQPRRREQADDYIRGFGYQGGAGRPAGTAPMPTRLRRGAKRRR